MVIAVKMGEWSVFPEKFVIKNSETEIQIKSLSMKLLCCLIEYEGKVVSKDTLIEKCWEGRIVSDDAVRQAIKELRGYLGCNGTNARYIETVRKQGYRLIAKYEPLKSEPALDNAVFEIDNIKPSITTLVFNKWFYSLLFIIASATLIYSLLQNKSYVLSNDSTTVTYEKERVLGYQKSIDGIDAYAVLRPGASFGQSIKIRDEEKNLLHTIKPTMESGHVTSPVFSPSGDKLVYLDYHKDQCTIRVIEPIKNEQIKAIKCSKSDYFVALDWVNDNELLYSSSPNESVPLALHKHNLVTGERFKLTEPVQGGRGDYLVRTCDNNGALLRNIDGKTTQVYYFDIKSGHFKMLNQFAEILPRLGWVPDCDAIVVYLYNRGIHTISLKDGSLKLINDQIHNVKSFQFIDNSFFVSAGKMFSIDIAKFAKGDKEPSVFISSNGNSVRLVKSPDLKSYAYVSTKTGLAQIWVYHNGEETQLTQFEEYISPSFIAWSTNSDYLYFSEGNAIWRIDLATKKSTKLHTSPGRINSFAYVDEETLLYTSFVNNLWQGYTFNLKTQEVKVIEDALFKEFRKDSTGAIFFRTPDDEIYRYNFDQKFSLKTMAPQACMDWTLEGQYFYCLANMELLEKDINSNEISSLMKSDNIGIRLYYHPDEGFYLEQARTGTINVSEYKLSTSYFN